MYHGTTSETPFDKFDLSKAGSATDYGNTGTAVSLTPSNSMGLYHAKGKQGQLMRVSANLKSPIEVIRDDNYINNIESIAKKLGVQANPKWSGYKQQSKEWADEFAKKAQEAGYDCTVTRMPNRNKDVIEVSVYDPNKLTIHK